MASFGKGMVATPQLLVLHKWIDEISFPSEDQLSSDAMKFFEESNGILDSSAKEQLKEITEDLVERLHKISVNSTARHRSRGVLTYTDPGEAGAFRLSYENALIELLRKHAFGSFRDLECYSSEDKRLLNLAWIESAMGPQAGINLSISQRVVKAFQAAQTKKNCVRMSKDAAECYREDLLENHFGKPYLVGSLESLSREHQSCSYGWQGDIEKVGGSLGTLAFEMDRESMRQASEVLNTNRKANIQWHELWRGGWFSDAFEQAGSSTAYTNPGTTQQKPSVSVLLGLECVSKEEGRWCHLVRIHNADRKTVRVDRKLTLFVCDYKLWRLLKSLLTKGNRFAALEIISWLTDLNSKNDYPLFDLLGIFGKGVPVKKDSTTMRPLDDRSIMHVEENSAIASVWPIV